MASISKIQIESGTFDIKDETARNGVATNNQSIESINNEITTFYKDDKLMVTDLVYKLNDNEISDITGLLKEEILK